MSGFIHGPRGRFGKVNVKQNHRIEPWERESEVNSERVYTPNGGSGADGWNKPGVRFQSPPRMSVNKAETVPDHVCKPMVVATDATGRIVSSYMLPNLDKESVIGKGGMVIEACGENCDDGDIYGGNGRYLVPSSKSNSSMMEGWNRPGVTNTGGPFRREQPHFSSSDAWARPSQTYNDGYHGKYEGGWSSGATATDEWSRPSNKYSSTPSQSHQTLDSRELARRYNGKSY